ncbi:hypothetical protein ACFOZ0_24745 [Streptomyces yaanensis]|uniref:Large membrane protein n=1 Tax=Streptomyces yaanensis TaxID=1142239 RepID=A0ABV7SHH9_9ACTN|nr:hypothetical protein [Streptomyces sp. CGMCC 4.7035]WNC01404.1 hypothetical protein Q2K21_26950 [Streptomyces sp. CGMCC 4.7035]
MNTERPDDASDAPEVTEVTEATEETDGSVPRGRRSPVVVASVAAAVLLVGGGGAYLAATASGGSGGSSTPGGDGTPPALVLDGYSEGGTPGIAVGEPNPYGTTYTAAGKLPDGPKSAPVYWAKGEVTRDEVARLAEALDLSGTPRLVGDTWQVGATKDGAQPNLRVNRNAPGTWTFSSYVPGTDNCPRGKMCRPIGSGMAGVRPGPVSEEAAKKAAAPVLKAVGQDDAKLDASQLLDRVRVVNAEPEVGGLPTYGWTTGLQISSEGKVLNGSGNLKAPLKGATYPVLGAKKTLDLMNGATPSYGRKGIGGCASPVPLKDRDEAPCGASTTVPKRASATVKGAVFGLARHSVNGKAVLVPSWLFEVKPTGAGTGDDFTVTHPAIEPRYLTAPQPPGQPSATPSPRTSAPGDQPSSAPTKRDVKVMGYTADGKDLTIAYEGGVCADYAASVSEGSAKVTVTVTETPWPDRVCIMIAKVYHETLRLKEPLGDRQVVGSDGKPIPKETASTLPKASTGGAGAKQPR